MNNDSGPAAISFFSAGIVIHIVPESLFTSLRNPLFTCPGIRSEPQPDRFYCMVSFRCAAIMGTQAMRNMIAREEMAGVAVLVVTGVTLIASRRKENRRP